MKVYPLLFLVLFLVHWTPTKSSKVLFSASDDLSATCVKLEIQKTPQKTLCHQISQENCILHAALRRNLHQRVHVVSSPIEIDEERTSGDSGKTLVEVFARSEQDARSFKSKTCQTVTFARPVSSEEPEPIDIVYPLSISGDSANRIDVVFMGDGYTEDQQSLFLDDMTRMASDMFVTQTFNTWLPLYNIWAVFRASDESGIGYYGTPKNTSYQLYRDGTELRGVYPGDPDAIRDSCQATGPNGCDYPTCIGNDPFYGGLGGQFSISTSSVRSGVIVLRHEFGHSMGKVGEEYDSGQHFGANVGRTLEIVNEQWGPWLSGDLQAEDSNDLVQQYPWYILGNDTIQQDYVVKFQSNGDYDRWYLLFSMSGCEADGVVNVSLDGELLDWHSCDSLDRCFYGFFSATPLDKGDHILVWHQIIPPTTIFPRQLCSISMLEYKESPEFHFNNGYVSAYPTYNENTNFRAYRSSNEACIMRNISSSEFCVADKQNLWLQLVGRVNLIDNITTTDKGDEVEVTLNLIPFGQFRDVPIDGEFYTSTWYQDGQLQADLTDQFNWQRSSSAAAGHWTVEVSLSTDDVRSDPNNILSASNTFVVS